MTPPRDARATAPVTDAKVSKRDLVLGVLQGADDFQSAQDIHANLRAAGQKVGLATVYRVLQVMQDASEVDALRNESGEVTYRSCQSGHHHHHLVCRVCGRTVEIEGPTVEKWADSMAAKHGYTDVSHTVEVFGVCGNH